MDRQAQVTTLAGDGDPGREWMVEFQGGDEEAFTRIVRFYGNPLAMFFQRFGADSSSSEDLTQEVFLRIYRARDRYRPTAPFRTWLYRIVRRIAINDSARNRWRQRLPLGPGEDEGAERGVEDPAAGPLARLGLQEVRQQVRAAVWSLPERQRAALLLHRFEGMSYEEVGAILGLGAAAVKSLLFRARDRLKKTLQAALAEEVRDDA